MAARTGERNARKDFFIRMCLTFVNSEMYDAITFLQGSKHIIEKSRNPNSFVNKIKRKEKLDSLTSYVEQLEPSLPKSRMSKY